MVVYTDPAAEDEGDLDSGAKTLNHNERIHYGDLKDRYRQRRDRTRQLVAQRSTLNTRNNLNPIEVRLLGKTISGSIATSKRLLLLFATSRTH